MYTVPIQGGDSKGQRAVSSGWSKRQQWNGRFDNRLHQQWNELAFFMLPVIRKSLRPIRFEMLET